METITIIVPCFNEQEVLEHFYSKVSESISEVKNCRFSFLFINDGSTDDTLAVLRQLASKNDNVSYIGLSRNFGKEAAMLAGLDYADGDAVIIMDADLQHPPQLIPEMVDWWHKGYDDVCTRRTNRTDESWFKRNMVNLFYRVMGVFSKHKLQRDVGDFRLLDRRCVAAMCLLRESQRFTKGLYTWVGYKKKEIPFTVQPRAAGKSTWSYIQLFNLAIEGLTSFSTAPLRMTTLLGIGVSVLALTYMCFVFFNALCYGDPVAGYPTLMTVLLFLGGVQLLSLGIIGEYLGRVFAESKGRPPYLVDELNGDKVIYDNTGNTFSRAVRKKRPTPCDNGKEHEGQE
ncbi:MAG: glycosyltransferase family 2 protein [Anaerovibrio sp.]|uniref:glycosyltransferase family 2 protein n=1 Tax=Anaerovibrio sp. TaxID=1872532 RepID=UPI0025EBC108|nr:glycosyltransferase family 2 protein [Anaerovibrio sp.]MCR5175604.1 glycosyltransferase family 2 protein [Anaerovibrio sp.]